LSDAITKARFIEPMLLLPTTTLPEGSNIVYEMKLDGYRALAIKTGGTVQLRSRNNNDFNRKYPALASAFAPLPDETVIDGEVVALDVSGRPSFNALQNQGSAKVPVLYYAFDLLMLAGRDVTTEPLGTRRKLLETDVLPRLSEPIRCSPQFNVGLNDLIQSVRAQGLEGVVAKRLDSLYESGKRSGAWQKMRINRGQEFVIGGYTVGGRSFDAVIFGYYEDDRLLYAGRSLNGFTPAFAAESAETLRRVAPVGPPPLVPTADAPIQQMPDPKMVVPSQLAVSGTCQPSVNPVAL
jgi:bifunctional non-homologous end joining protein LigD